MSEVISNNKIKAQHFHSTKGFIDDLREINDGGEFGRTNAESYPTDLQLKPEHQGTRASFLNLDINIVDGKFVYKLPDKKDSFPLTFVGETLRIARLTLHFPEKVTAERQSRKMSFILERSYK